MRTTSNENSRAHRGVCGFAVPAAAFTLIELLVVISIIAILAGMLLPALGKAKAKAQGIQSLSNHKPLTLAWTMYAVENRDRIPYSAGNSGSPVAWFGGMLDFDGGNRSNWDVEQDLKKARCGSAREMPKASSDARRSNRRRYRPAALSKASACAAHGAWP